MRVTDDRYARDLARFDLAMRMIRHEARTHTIRACTGLTEDRIRKLYRNYFVMSPEEHAVRRKRGKSPRQVAFFTRNALTHLHASLLAGILANVGLLENCRSSGAGRSLEFGALFCDAFETYQQLCDGAQLSFEHGWFLLAALASGEDLKVERCTVCSGAFVCDPLGLAPAHCPLCRMRTGHRQSRRLLVCRDAPGAS